MHSLANNNNNNNKIVLRRHDDDGSRKVCAAETTVPLRFGFGRSVEPRARTAVRDLIWRGESSLPRDGLSCETGSHLAEQRAPLDRLLEKLISGGA